MSEGENTGRTIRLAQFVESCLLLGGRDDATKALLREPPEIRNYALAYLGAAHVTGLLVGEVPAELLYAPAKEEEKPSPSSEGVRLGTLPAGTRFRVIPDSDVVYRLAAYSHHLDGSVHVHAEVLTSPRMLAEKREVGRHVAVFSSTLLTVYPDEPAVPASPSPDPAMFAVPKALLTATPGLRNASDAGDVAGRIFAKRDAAWLISGSCPKCGFPLIAKGIAPSGETHLVAEVRCRGCDASFTLEATVEEGA